MRQTRHLYPLANEASNEETHKHDEEVGHGDHQVVEAHGGRESSPRVR